MTEITPKIGESAGQTGRRKNLIWSMFHFSLKSDRFAGRVAGQERMGKPMRADDLMDDFPPPPDRLVTLSNWRKAPFSAWGLRNVRRLIPTANIAAASDAAALEMSLEEIGHVGFADHDGHPTTLRQALRATRTDAFVVLRRGRIAAEWYDNGMDATTPHIVFSVSKSICGTLGGILAGRGLLDPDDRA